MKLSSIFLFALGIFNTYAQPIITLSTEEGSHTNKEHFYVYIDSSEPTYGLEKSDFEVVNGTIDGLVQERSNLLAFGERGTGEGEFIYPANLAIGKSGNIYVVDRTNNRVQVFNEQG